MTTATETSRAAETTIEAVPRVPAPQPQTPSRFVSYFPTRLPGILSVWRHAEFWNTNPDLIVGCSAVNQDPASEVNRTTRQARRL